MKRNELPEYLFKNIDIVKPHPEKVAEVDTMLNLTAFFPGGRGLWQEEESEEFPTILVLGQDFSTVNAYEEMKKDKLTDLQSPTWRNLIKLFEAVDIDLKKCFFSNVFMGLRDTQSMTGKFPGFKDKDYINRSIDFLLFQIETIKPKLIITLGLPASEMLAKAATLDLNTWSNGSALRDKNEGYKSNIRFKKHRCSCAALEHTSMRVQNLKYRAYKNFQGHDAEVELLRGAMRDVEKSLKSVEYNKLIRDKIPEIIEKSGKQSVLRVADGTELLSLLNNKLQEELNEYNESGEIEELADLYEVVLAIMDCKGVSISEFEKIRIEKRDKRGAFKKGLVLEKVIDETG